MATNVSCLFQSFVAVQNTRTLHDKAPVLTMSLYCRTVNNDIARSKKFENTKLREQTCLLFKFQ